MLATVRRFCGLPPGSTSTPALTGEFTYGDSKQARAPVGRGWQSAAVSRYEWTSWASSTRASSTIHLEEVFAWHTRPGAMPRLVPPWQPMKVVAETTSVANGRAVLGLPAGLRWVAQHEGADFDPPYRFVDQLSSDGVSSWPPRVIGIWRHTHDFIASGPEATRVHDRVEAPVPAAALRPTFVYRHRQLADDLAAHRDATNAGLSPSPSPSPARRVSSGRR